MYIRKIEPNDFNGGRRPAGVYLLIAISAWLGTFL